MIDCDDKDLKGLLQLPLEEKIKRSKMRIIEFHSFMNGKVYIAFSGGRDSTVLLHLVRSVYPDVVGVFSNTGLEWPEIVEFVKQQENITIVRPKISYKQVIEKYGYAVISKEQAQYIGQYRIAKSEKTKNTRWNGNKYGRGKISEKWKFLVNAPFKISDECCNHLKKNPSKVYEKETGNMPFIGTRVEESSKRVQEWQMYGCNAYENKRPTSKPLSFWTERDIREYLSKYQIPIAKIYNNPQIQRTGCIWCLFGYQHEKKLGIDKFETLKELHPKIHDFAMNKLGLKRVIDYIDNKGEEDEEEFF